MATVSFWVGKIIEKQPFVLDSLSKGLINHAALADSMIPELEEKLKKKIKFSAVNMAIRRLSEKLEKTYKPKIKFRKNTDLTLKSNLVAYIIKNQTNISIALRQVYNKIHVDRGDFLTITNGLHETMIVINAVHEADIEEIFQKKNIAKKINGLSGINMNLPSEAIETPGLYYFIIQAIFWNNISLIDLVSTFNELTVIVKDEDATETFDTLRRLVKNNS